MSAPSPSSLPSIALARRLADLCGEERNVQGDFLLHLSEFDLRRAYLEAGYGSLWTFCLEALHLRESAAGRRIGAMKVLRRLPALEQPLRDGRLCLSTICMLGPVLTAENLDDVVARAAFLSKADTEKLVVSLQPRTAPRDGIRKLAAADGRSIAPVAPAAETVSGPGQPGAEGASEPMDAAPAAASVLPVQPTGPERTSPRTELTPVSADVYSLRVTIGGAFKRDLDELATLTSHAHRGDLASILHDAVRCAIARHGMRRGAVEPKRRRTLPSAKPTTSNEAASSACGTSGVASQASVPPNATAALESTPANPDSRSFPALPGPTGAAGSRYIPIEIRRAVWKRDGGCCAWVSPDGKRCGSRDRLEFDHIDPVALGGKARVDRIRLVCKAHNLHAAVRVFGRAKMAPYLGGFTTSSGSDA